MNTQKLLVLAVLVGGVAGLSYWLGTRSGGEPVIVQAETAAAPTTAGSDAAGTPAVAGGQGAADSQPETPATPTAATEPAPVAGESSSSAIPHTARSAATDTRDLMPDAQEQQVRFTHFRVGNRNVKSMLAEGDNVWVGTSGGVIRYNIRTEEHKLFDNRGSLLANGVFHVSKLRDGRIVVGTYGGGMSVYQPADGSWVTYNIPHGMADAFIYDVLELPNGDLWLATWSGANRVRGGNLDDPESWDLFTVENTAGGLPNDWVYGLEIGRNGEVWMATEGGLARFADETWSNWNHQAGLGAPYEQVRDQIKFTRDPSKESEHHARQKVEQGLTDVNVAYNPNYVVALQVDAEGVVWVGTWGGGLSRFDGENWKTYTVDDGLPSNHVFMLHIDPSGRLWAGTSDGLVLKTGENFRLFTRNDGLLSDTVFSMVNSSDGMAWVGSYGGVARIQGLGD